MRLHLDTMTKMPFADFHTALAGDKVYAFFIHKNEPIVLSDDASMFPSDAFITQLRLLMD